MAAASSTAYAAFRTLSSPDDPFRMQFLQSFELYLPVKG